MRKVVSIALLSALLSNQALSADANGWKQRAVYQLVTDRFAKGSGDKSNCNLGA